MSWLFLGISLVGLLLTLNAFWPPRWEPVGNLAFFSGWIVSEAPLHAAAAGVAAAVVFWQLGALGDWPGWAALAVTAASCVALTGLVRVAQRAASVTEEALERGLGPGWRSYRDRRVDSSGAATVTRLQLVVPVWVRDRRVERIRNIDYWGDGIHAHRLDLYRPRRQPAQPAPVLVYVHGGGWVIGDKREQGLPLMAFLASQGWVCVTVNYRLSPRATWPDHLVDVKRAVAWVKKSIGDYGGDPGFVAVSGGSAGGHLASLVALTPQELSYQPGFESLSTSVQACVSFYGVYDFTGDHGFRGGKALRRLLERSVLKVRYDGAPEQYRSASPMERIGANAPPFMVVHGTNDTLVAVEEARGFAQKLRRTSRSPVVYVELPFAQHAFDVFRSIRTAHVVGAVTDFLAYVRGTGARSGMLSGCSASPSSATPGPESPPSPASWPS